MNKVFLFYNTAMRILSLQCKHFSYKAVRPAEFLMNDRGVSEEATRSWRDCLLLLVSVEPNDRNKVNKSAKAVRRVVKNSGSKVVVINGFAHLVDVLAEPTESRQVLTALYERLAEVQEVQIFVTPFGWHKELEMHVAADQWSQRFIHI